VQLSEEGLGDPLVVGWLGGLAARVHLVGATLRTAAVVVGAVIARACFVIAIGDR